MMHTDSPLRPHNCTKRLRYGWGILFVWLLAIPLGATAACTIEYSDGLIHALSRATGQYVPKQHGNFSNLAQCQSALNDAVIKSGDPTLRMNMKCTGCSSSQQQGQGSSSGVDASAQAAKKKFDAQKKAEEQAAQQQFLRDKQKLSQELKGVTPSPSNAIVLKSPPPSDAARQQLDCVLRDSLKSESDNRLPPGGDWQNLRDCTPLDVAVPPVPEPVPAGYVTPTNEAAGREFLSGIVRQLMATRQQLKQQDQEIVRLEQELAQVEARKPVGGLKEAPRESDALKRAREALAKARASRQQTAEQLQRLEEQEKMSTKGQRTQ
ncbi:MAG: hypothetical protein ABII81_06255 [Pseudomonadota bacterium]